MKLFVVLGCQGEYSDYSEWPVRAYGLREEAQAEAERMAGALQVWLNDHENFCAGDLWPEDPEGWITFTTEYFVSEVPIKGELESMLRELGKLV